MAYEPFIGEVCIYAFTFAPDGWANCDGATFSIQSNTALYSLLGVTYGGNGSTTFQLPDLRGRVVVGQGQAPGFSSYQLGQKGGSETVTLTIAQIPAHTHALMASNQSNTNSPVGAFSADSGSNAYNNTGGITMNAGAIGNAGGSQPHDIRQPYLALRYCIATQGIYPMRP